MNSVAKKYIKVVSTIPDIRNANNYYFYLERLFNAVDFKGKRVLDIGGGYGLISFYAAIKGASHIVCLEPEASGSFSDLEKKFYKIADNIPDLPVHFRAETIQDTEFNNETFDVIIMHNCINHLNVQACRKLHLSEDAKRIYRVILSRIADLASDGASLIVSDCSRYNLFGMFRVKNPFAPTIGWNSHQTPGLWSQLLHDAGFVTIRTRWHAFSQLKHFGTLFFSNMVMAFLTGSYFYIDAEKR
ncbi:MAG: hypothetical protein CMB97_00075 [Flavobacteriaceae bacterium]|nr:hypothetical protein [Flavobacteriaceae bacterium]